MRKFLGYSGLIGALLVLGGGLFLLTRLMTFRAELDQLESDGYPVSLLDLAVPVAIDQPDGAGAFRRLEGPVVAYETEMFEDDFSLDSEFGETEIKLYAELNEAYPTVMPLIDEIVKAGIVSFDVGQDDSETVIDEKIMRMQKVRSCARVLCFKAKVLAADGDPDAGLRAAIDILKISNAFETTPTMVSQLVRTACQGISLSTCYGILSRYAVSDEARRDLNAALERIEVSDQYKQSLISERAFGITVLSEMGTIGSAFDGPSYINVMQFEIEQSELESFEQDFTFEEDLGWMDGWAAPSMVPALQQSRFAHFRMLSHARALRILNALLASPESVEKDPSEITVEYLKSIGVPESMTLDTMDGKPMKIKREDDRWVVYSVGRNLVDDGGSQDQFEDFVISE